MIDASRVLGGPFCGQILADHGADVIKVEPPMGDETRGWGPPFVGDAASYFIGVNRNKRDVSVDMTQPLGQETPSTNRKSLLLRINKPSEQLTQPYRPIDQLDLATKEY